MYISIDLGGTKTRVACSEDLKSLGQFEKFDSAQDLNEQKDLVIGAIKKVSEGKEIDAIALGVPGIIDKVARTFQKIPNYKIIEGHSLEVLISPDYRNVPLFVENDAALAGLAEAVLGAGKNYNSIAYITLSTGVGGVKIENKISSISQKVFEPGHHVINMDSDYVDNAGVKGSMEAYLSGTAFEKIYGIKPQECNDALVWEKYGNTLAIGILNITTMWDPEIIVLGGSLTNKFELFLSGLEDGLRAFSSFNIPPVVRSVYGDNAGLIGGLEYIKQNNV